MCIRDSVREDVLAKLGAGIIFTGGGAAMPGLIELAQSIFGVPCSIGKDLNVCGLEGVENPQSYAVSAGLLLYGYKEWERGNLADSRRGFKNFFGGLFSR